MTETYNALDFPTDSTTGQSASLLDLAQKVHDDYVEKGRQRAEELEFDAQTKHDELTKSAKEFHDITILEAESAAASIVEDAQLTAFSTVSDAKRQADEILAGIEGTKLKLEASVLKLQEFESAYRSQLQALVAGAQATLTVAQLVIEDAVVPESETEAATEAKDEETTPVIEPISATPETQDIDDEDEVETAQTDEAPADDVEESDAEPVSYHLNVTPSADFFDLQFAKDEADSETDDVTIDQPVGGKIYDLDAAEVVANDDADSVAAADNETEEAVEEDDSEDDTVPGVYTLTEEFAPKVEHYTLPETAETASYDPIAKTASIDSETVASILASSGLKADAEETKADKK